MRIARVVIYLFLILVMMFNLFPIYLMITTSIKTRVEALAMPPKWIFTPTLRAYIDVLTLRPELPNYLVNSLIIGVSASVLSLVVGIPAAYALSRFQFKQRDDVLFWVLSTRAAPPLAVIIPFYIMFRQFGLIDTHLGVIIVYMSITLPLIIWMMKTHFDEVPKEIEECSLVDGCSRKEALLRVTLPLAAPGIVATAILCLVFTWNEFLFAFMLTSLNARTISVAMYTFIAYTEIYWGELSAAGIISSLPVIIFAMLVQKQLIRGLTAGAVKG